MATPKIWTADDVQQGRLAVLQDGTTLHIERRYQFIDGEGVVLESIAGGRLTAQIEWSAIPVDIQTALQTINNWTYNQILAQEGME